MSASRRGCDWLGDFGALEDCVGLLQSIAYDCNFYQILLS